MSTIVLAYSGGFASSNAVHWLADAYAADVVTITLDVGQGEDLAAIRARALSCGARRAHAIDARDELARDYLLPTLARPLDEGAPPIGELTRPLLARKLLETARIEGASVVAHGSADEWLEPALRALDPSITILAPARDWQMDAAQLAAYARARGIAPRSPSAPRCHVVQSLWGRMVSFPDGESRPEEARSRASALTHGPALLDIRFEGGVPVAVNDVPLPPVELLECVALIAGRHGVGRLERRRGGSTVVYDAPAAVVLHTARAALGAPAGIVRLSVRDGRCTLHAPDSEEVVNPS